ncbi:MAG: helix-turn-helix domain-containing protein [Faecalibacillus sp.]
MEFGEKLQELRKRKNMTQEELAEVLFVSRTAISKWESGRGYPNIESLKAISYYFQISIDDLLSGEELLTLAQNAHQIKMAHLRDLFFGLLDSSLVLFLFLPFFGQKMDGYIKSVSLIELKGIQMYILIPYFILVFVTVIWGILLLALQNYEASLWIKMKNKVSLTLSIVATLLFMISLQPYAAVLTFIFLMIKIFLVLKLG